ncbi:T9SS type A sorting domain-containing protein [Flavobacterium piscinae]|uniref:GEVED domain-containing protein n=1 Tax=Flavobacterium piscinae TaxID=2506424 RepID=UPI00199EA01F|nr:GEVED domain-containing protein [Flavobacterium piscinae]MBC8883228.1 T9SS type A sorting domain-containing protein [Flavobacterium piscinae]
MSWTAPTSGPAPTEYKVFFGTTSGSLTQIGTTANLTFNASAPAYSTTYYWQIVPTSAIGGGDAIGCAEWSFTTQADPFAPYCSAITFSSNVEPITSVNFAGIDNQSSATLNGTPALQNFISISGNVTAGESYTMTLKGNTDGNFLNNFRVFIDWNQDGDFNDENETFNAGTVQNSTGLDALQAVSNIEVPSNALPGTTRMRVKKIFGTTNIDNPCVGTSYGQVEDYSLLVSIPWYLDADNDTYGDDNNVVVAVENPFPGLYVSVGGDCDDTNASINPGAAEICYDGLDNDCDGIIDNGCTPIVSVVQPAQCGITLPTIDSYVYANLVAGAQGYRFRVTNLSTNEVQTIDRALRVFRFTQLTSYAFATEYSVEVSVRINNVWQPFYGTPCTVSTPDTTTQIQASQCNTAISNLNNSIFADIVPFATGYRFRVTNTLNPIDVQTIDRPIRDFRMTNLATVEFNTTYNVEVAVRNTDGTYLSYGAVCNITTPMFPTVGLEDAQCDEYLVSSNTETLFAESYPGVEQYRFLLENINLPYSQTVDRATRTVTLNNFTGLVPGEMYTVRVAIRLNGVWGPYGKSCSIITPGGEIILIRPEESTNETGFKAVAYPNPFATSFTVDVRTSNTEAVSLTVYDMAGRLLEVREVKAQDVTNYQFGNQYPSGVYNVIVTQGEETRAVRVVKQ